MPFDCRLIDMLSTQPANPKISQSLHWSGNSASRHNLIRSGSLNASSRPKSSEKYEVTLPSIVSISLVHCGMTNKMCLSSSVYSDGTGAVMNDTDDSSSAVASVKQTPALELKHRHSVDQRYPRTAGLRYVD